MQSVLTREELFRRVMAGHPSGLAVVTTGDAQGRPRGLAVTAFASFSADPPSVVVSLSRDSRSHDAFLASARFGVHLLEAGDTVVADRFTSKADDKFAGLDWSWDHEVPHLDGALGYLRCHRVESFGFADHTLLIGELEDGDVRDGDPMLYYRRSLDWRICA